jgi:hypothetical protein
MLVPKPKNAFQSPGVHKVGLFVADAVIARSRQLPGSILNAPPGCAAIEGDIPDS